ncbi:hypothetical protein D1627_02395 [Pontibacter oryzae]|uniref:Uncharacterized protein n=2 Tax=Pontibacter oryzae TaxID=2304593 RepID=A0A399SF25_9BACT|nr:hypothetical protein D1627_02395 [Pontibacter oryzae]
MGAFFLASDPLFFQGAYLHHVPVAFMLRFSMFWFCSFVLAILVFLLYIRRHAHAIQPVDKRLALRFSAYAFSFGAMAAALIGYLLYLAAY